MKREFALPAERAAIVMTEEVDAPVERAWTARFEPLYLAQWWRPRGYVNPIVDVEAEVGSRWRIVQRDPQGNEFSFYGTFTEVEPLVSTVQTYVSELFPDIVTELSTEFIATETGTLVVTTHDLGQEAYRRGYLRSGALERMSEASENYGHLLAQLMSR